MQKDICFEQKRQDNILQLAKAQVHELLSDNTKLEEIVVHLSAGIYKRRNVK